MCRSISCAQEEGPRLFLNSTVTWVRLMQLTEMSTNGMWLSLQMIGERSLTEATKKLALPLRLGLNE